MYYRRVGGLLVFNPYKVLGVSPMASESEMKSAYRSLCRKYHPDSVTGNREKFIEISKAWEVICSAPVTKPIIKKARWHHKSLFTIIKEVK